MILAGKSPYPFVNPTMEQVHEEFHRETKKIVLVEALHYSVIGSHDCMCTYNDR